MQTSKHSTFKRLIGGGIAAAAISGGAIVAQAPVASASNVWDRLAECESNGNWSINTGNGYYGGLQFSQQSWQAVGGSGLPSQASKAEQISRAQQLHAIQGWGAWPSCASQLGLYGESPNAGATSSGSNTGGQSQQQAPSSRSSSPLLSSRLPSSPLRSRSRLSLHRSRSQSQSPSPRLSPSQSRSLNQRVSPTATPLPTPLSRTLTLRSRTRPTPFSRATPSLKSPTSSASSGPTCGAPTPTRWRTPTSSSSATS